MGMEAEGGRGRQTGRRGISSVCVLRYPNKWRKGQPASSGKKTASPEVKKPFLTSGNKGPGLPEPSPDTGIVKHSSEPTEGKEGKRTSQESN